MRNRKGTVAVLAAAGLATFAALRGRIRRYEILERSMEPSLAPGDYVLAWELGEPERGDIVIVAHPRETEFELVKRIIGLPGELVTLSNGQVHINDRVLPEIWADGPSLPDGSWQLGPGEAFVLGDNRPASRADSRTLGPVHLVNMKWQVVGRYWPPARIGKLTSSPGK